MSKVVSKLKGSAGFTKNALSGASSNIFSTGGSILSILLNPIVLFVYLVLIGGITVIYSQQAHADLFQLAWVVAWRAVFFPVELFLVIGEFLLNAIVFILVLAWNIIILIAVGLFQILLQIGDIVLGVIVLVIFMIALLIFAGLDIAAYIIITVWDVVLIIFDAAVTIFVDRLILGFVGIIFTLMYDVLKIVSDFTAWAGINPATWLADALDGTIFAFDSDGYDITIFGINTGLKTKFVGDLWEQTGHVFIMGRWDNVLVGWTGGIFGFLGTPVYETRVTGGLIVDPSIWRPLSLQLVQFFQTLSYVLPKDWVDGLLNFQFEYSHIPLREYFYDALANLGLPKGLLEEFAPA